MLKISSRSWTSRCGASFVSTSASMSTLAPSSKAMRARLTRKRLNGPPAAISGRRLLMCKSVRISLSGSNSHLPDSTCPTGSPPKTKS